MTTPFRRITDNLIYNSQVNISKDDHNTSQLQETWKTVTFLSVNTVVSHCSVSNRYNIFAPTFPMSTPPFLRWPGARLIYFCVADHRELDPSTCLPMSVSLRLLSCVEGNNMKLTAERWLGLCNGTMQVRAAVMKHWGHTVLGMGLNMNQLLANKMRTSRWCHWKNRPFSQQTEV